MIVVYKVHASVGALDLGADRAVTWAVPMHPPEVLVGGLLGVVVVLLLLSLPVEGDIAHHPYAGLGTYRSQLDVVCVPVVGGRVALSRTFRRTLLVGGRSCTNLIFFLVLTIKKHAARKKTFLKKNLSNIDRGGFFSQKK